MVGVAAISLNQWTFLFALLALLASPIAYTKPSPTCSCNHFSGGCKMVKSIGMEGKACRCINVAGLACSQLIVPCANPQSHFCKNPDNSLLACLQGGGDCGGYAVTETAGQQGCNCEYRHQGIIVGGGCIIVNPAPKNYACKCNALGRLPLQVRCNGRVQLCKNYSDPTCTNPGIGSDSCAQGQGECSGYD